MGQGRVPVCATCLSGDRSLAALCSVSARRCSVLLGADMKVEDMYICWECRAVLLRMLQFQQRAVRALEWLERAHRQHDAEVFKEVKSISPLLVSRIKTVPDFEICYEGNILLVPEINVQMLDQEDRCFGVLKPDKKEVGDGVSVTDVNYNDDLEDPEIVKNINLVDAQLFNKANREKIVKNIHADNNKPESLRRVKLDELKPSGAKATESVLSMNGLKGKVVKKANAKCSYKKKYYLKKHCEIARNYYNTIRISEEEMLKVREAKKMSAAYCRRPYKCEGCICAYTNKSDLSEHNSKWHNRKTGPHMCYVCKTLTKTKAILEKHVQAHYEQYRCKLCGYMAWKLNQIFSHKRIHHRDGRLYGCRKCEGEFNTLIDFRHHWKTLHVNYCCDKCDKICKSRNTIKQHLRRKHVSYDCDICKKSFKYDKKLQAHKLSKHRVFVKPLRPISPSQCYCVECDKHFTCIPNMKLHIYNMHNPKRPQHECTYCHKIFKNKRAMNNHYNLEHLKRTDHHCSICSKYFVHAYSLQKHTRCVHGGHREPKNKFCSVCGRAFNSNATIANHMRTHTGERPYECDYCSASFAQRTALQTHIKHIHLDIKRSANRH